MFSQHPEIRTNPQGTYARSVDQDTPWGGDRVEPPPKWSNWNDGRMALLWVSSITVSLKWKQRKETCYQHTHIWISSRSENKQKKLLMFPKPMGFCPSPVKASQPLGFQACTTPVAEMVKCSPSFAAVDTVDSVPKGRCFAGTTNAGALRQLIRKWIL